MSILVLLQGAIVGLSLADAPAPPDGKGAPAQVAALIGQLGSKRYAEREEASRALDVLGPRALAALRQAQQSTSPEVRRRAHALVRAIERRLETARLLTPSRLRLVYKDTPLPDAVADLARRTGLALRLEGDPAKFAARKITLDTGEVPSWEAYFLFCRRAGLREADPAPANLPPIRGGGVSVTIVGGGAAQPTARDVMRPPAETPVTLVLTDGEPAAPTHLAGSVRFRALPPDAALAAVRKPGEGLLTLEATVEPALRWRQVIGVRLDRAVDDQGQARKGGAAPPAPRPPAPQRGMVVINGQVIEPPDDGPRDDGRRMPLRIEPAAKAGRVLKELTGVVTVLVQSPPEDLVSVHGVLKAVGKRFAGPQGSAVHIGDATRLAGGAIRLRVEVQAIPRGLSDGSAAQVFNQTIIINGRRLGEREEVLSAQNFVLLDGQGKAFRVTAAVNTGKRQGVLQEYEVTYQPEEGQGAPTWFVYRDRRSAVVEIPFTLRDVPLP